MAISEKTFAQRTVPLLLGALTFGVALVFVFLVGFGIYAVGDGFALLVFVLGLVGFVAWAAHSVRQRRRM